MLILMTICLGFNHEMQTIKSSRLKEMILAHRNYNLCYIFWIACIEFPITFTQQLFKCSPEMNHENHQLLFLDLVINNLH